MSCSPAGGRPTQGADCKALAEEGVSFVQLFDAISLGLCTAERRDAWQVRRADGAVYTFTPLALNRIRVEPWPLVTAQLTVRTAGRSIPQACYATREELLAAAGEAVELEWRLAEFCS